MYILINLTFVYNIDFKSFRFYKEIYIFELINYVFCYFILMVGVNLFIFLNKKEMSENI